MFHKKPDVIVTKDAQMLRNGQIMSDYPVLHTTCMSKYSFMTNITLCQTPPDLCFLYYISMLREKARTIVALTTFLECIFFMQDSFKTNIVTSLHSSDT